jgi:hypothetical protein
MDSAVIEYVRRGIAIVGAIVVLTLGAAGNITREIAHDVRSQYVVVYKPRNQGARPAYQSVRMEARAKGYGHLTVRTRSGYSQGEK